MFAVESMHIEIREEACSLIDYAAIPIAFEVTSVLDVTKRAGTDEFLLADRALEVPFVKDYDAIPGESPMHWAERFDFRNWRFFGAWSDGRRVGGAAVVHATPTLELLEGHADVAVLWDVPACRFYQQLGFVLKTVNQNAYAAFPDETQLLWYKPVARSALLGRS